MAIGFASPPTYGGVPKSYAGTPKPHGDTPESGAVRRIVYGLRHRADQPGLRIVSESYDMEAVVLENVVNVIEVGLVPVARNYDTRYAQVGIDVDKDKHAAAVTAA